MRRVTSPPPSDVVGSSITNTPGSWGRGLAISTRWPVATQRPPALAAVWRVAAGDDSDERRLPGAVLSEQGMDLTPAHVEAHVLQRGEPREGLVDAVQLDDARHQTTPLPDRPASAAL